MWKQHRKKNKVPSLFIIENLYSEYQSIMRRDGAVMDDQYLQKKS